MDIHPKQSWEQNLDNTKKRTTTLKTLQMLLIILADASPARYWELGAGAPDGGQTALGCAAEQHYAMPPTKNWSLAWTAPSTTTHP